MKLEGKSDGGSSPFSQDIEDKENNRKLKINAVEEVEGVDWLTSLLYYMAASMSAHALNIHLGFLGMMIAFFIVTYAVAPILATVVLKAQVRRYIEKNHKRLLAQNNGMKRFSLYDRHYALTWTTESFGLPREDSAY